VGGGSEAGDGLPGSDRSSDKPQACGGLRFNPAVFQRENMKKSPPIKSAKEAKVEVSKLDSVWSRESYLSLRTLVYIASLLEQIAGKPKRKRSKWNEFLSKRLKAGMTVKEAATAWRFAKGA